MHYLALLLTVFGLSTVFAAPSCTNEEEGEGSIHAVIVAGTNVSAGLAYALQGAAYEAYHMLTDRGVPKENIVLMSWDDAANDSGNPIPGKIYSTPEKTRDVREGVQIDFKGADVNPKNILAVLSGNKTAVKGGNGRVLESTSKDKVFVFFASHGYIGVWFVGNQLDVPIHALELQTTLKEMHADGKFAELYFVMEACHSGSMFDALPKDINIYAITSSNRDEDSKCIYCPYWGACLHGEDNWVCKLNGCVSGLFRNKIMSDDIESNQEGETLQKQYEGVKSEVAEFCNKHWTTNCQNESQTVSHFGDFNIAKEPVTDFVGKESTRRSAWVEENERPYAVWSFKDAEMRQLEHRFSMAVARGDYVEGLHFERAIDDLKEKYAKVDKFLAGFVSEFVGEEQSSDYVLSAAPERLTQLECHDTAVRAFQAKCVPQIGGTAYAGKYASVMAALCESGVSQGEILARIEDYC
ncbi:Peptidase C13 family protein [Aphelenchoides avenae]|nr:Peptidase C13 family protein [Aphelenchus avenae]